MQRLKVILIAGVLLLPSMLIAQISEKETLVGIIDVILMDSKEPIIVRAQKLSQQVDSLEKLLGDESSEDFIFDTDLKQINLVDIIIKMNALESTLLEEVDLTIVRQVLVGASVREENPGINGELSSDSSEVNILSSQYFLGMYLLDYLSIRGLKSIYACNKELIACIEMRATVLDAAMQ